MSHDFGLIGVDNRVIILYTMGRRVRYTKWEVLRHSDKV